MSLLDDASLILTPNGYKGGSPNGKLYSVKPTSGAGDMVVTRNTTSTRVNSAGLIESVAFNAPRLDYPPLGGCPSILVEPQRKNEVTYSEQFDNLLGWSAVNAIVNANVAVAPDNNTTADKFIPTLVNSVHFLQQTPLASYAYTFSVFAKAGGETTFSMWLLGGNKKAEFNLTGVGSVISTTFDVTAKIDPYPNGWYRCSMYNALAGTDVRIYGRGGTSFEGNGVDGIFLWGAQAEATTALTATSYIPTVASTITRNDDVITKTGISSLIGQSEGTIFWDVKDLVGSVSPGNPEFTIRNTAFSNWIGITTNTSANPFRITVRTSTPTIIIDYSANITSAKACVKYGTFGAKLFLNGNPTPVATSLVNPNFSFDNILFRGSLMSYKTNLFALWTTALSDAQCKDLTT